MTESLRMSEEIETFMDALAMMMEDEAVWATFIQMLDARRKVLKAKKP